MTQYQKNVELWAAFSELDEAGDLDGCLKFITETDLKEDAAGQRYVAWVHAQRGDIANASRWYLEAALQGDAAAVDECYACARHMEANGLSAELVGFCETPVLSTLERFQRLMASHYYRAGMTSKLLEWVKLLAERGREDDLVYLGKLCLFEQQPLEALVHLEKAASLGNGEANELLGEMHHQGIGVEVNEVKAMSYYERSSKLGFVVSTTRLLHAKRSKRGIWYLPIFAVALLWLIIKTILIEFRNSEDPRLALTRASCIR